MVENYGNNYYDDENVDFYFGDEFEEYDDDYYYDNDDYYEKYNYDYDDYGYYDDNYYYNDYEKDNIEDMFIFNNKSSFTQIVDDLINPNPYTEINDDYLKVLMIAEKQSITKTISKIL